MGGGSGRASRTSVPGAGEHDANCARPSLQGSTSIASGIGNLTEADLRVHPRSES